MSIFVIAVFSVMIGGLWIRLAPSPVSVWHVLPAFDADQDFNAGVIRVRHGDAAIFKQLHKVASADPRTRVLAGDLVSGKITYISRSAFWGFPDYTTIGLEAQTLRIYARLRFGLKDLGVNQRRVERWLERL